MTAIIIACGGSLIAATGTIVALLLQRKWQKEDRTADRISELSDKMEDVQDTLDSHIKADAENDAKQARRRIIVFSDECRRGMLHSSETSTAYWTTSHSTGTTARRIQASATKRRRTP